MDDASKIDLASMFLASVAMVWWRRCADVEKGLCMIMIEATHLTESICEMVKEFFR